MSRILVLGGTGFIGTPVAQALRAGRADVLTLGRSTSADVPLDVLEPGALESFLRRERFDVVVNLAGAGLAAESVGLTTMTAVNADLPGRALGVLLDSPRPPAFVHAASSTERLTDDEPDESEYSRTKHAGAQAVRGLAGGTSTPVVVVRIHNTYGADQPRTRFVSWVVHELGAGRPVHLHHPGRERDFVHLDDVVEGLVAVSRAPATMPREVELGTGIGTTLSTVALSIAALLGRPAALVGAAASPGADPHPRAVAAAPGGTLGVCRTTLPDGLNRTVRT